MEKNRVESLHNSKYPEIRNSQRVEKVNQLTESYRNEEPERVVEEDKQRVYEVLVVDPPLPEANPHVVLFPLLNGSPNFDHEGSKDHDQKAPQKEKVGCQVHLRAEVSEISPFKNGFPGKNHRYHIRDDETQVN